MVLVCWNGTKAFSVLIPSNKISQKQNTGNLELLKY